MILNAVHCNDSENQCTAFQRVVTVDVIEHPASVLRGLASLLRDRCMCDVILVVGGLEFVAHRVLLASCSEYFRKLLGSDWKEGREKRVCLEDVDATSFQYILDFVYTGRVDLEAAADLPSLLRACEQLRFESLRERLVDLLRAELGPSNACDLCNLSDALCFVDLQVYCVANRLTQIDIGLSIQSSSGFFCLKRQLGEVCSKRFDFFCMRYSIEQAAATSVIVQNFHEVIQNGQIVGLNRGACPPGEPRRAGPTLCAVVRSHTPPPSPIA